MLPRLRHSEKVRGNRPTSLRTGLHFGNAIMKNERILGIEVIRIVACFIVICLHTITWFRTPSHIIENSLLIRCFLADGVPLFWLIMGFFLFRNPNMTLWGKLGKTARDLLFPAFLVMLVAQIWKDWIVAGGIGEGFLACLDFHSFDAKNLFGNIIKWKSDMTYGGHLWYVFSYVIVILWMPLLRYICVDEPRANKCRQYVMLLTALSILNSDVRHLLKPYMNWTLVIQHIISPTLLYVMLGYELSRFYDAILLNAKKVRVFGFLGWFCFCVLKSVLVMHNVRISPYDTYFLGIGTSLGFLSSISLFLALVTFNFRDMPRFIGEGMKNVASTTLGVYLIHPLIYRKVKALGIRDWFYSPYTHDPTNLFVEIGCSLSYAAFIFVLCCVFVMLLRCVRRSISTVFSRTQTHYTAKTETRQ